jgi:hypothetical protein
MTERIIPDCMKAPAVETASPADHEVTARFENVVENHCPVCEQPMRRSEANGVPIMICHDHAIAMPTKDE